MVTDGVPPGGIGNTEDTPAGDPALDAAWPAEYPGTEEVPLIDWPRIFRARLAARVRNSDRYRWWALWAVLAGLFASGFTITILGVSLATIAADLHTAPSTATWILNGPLLTLAVVMPLMGKLGDTHGHRRVYLAGFAVFTLLAIPTALAPSMGALIALRVVGAAGGAATNPASMAIVMHSFPEEDRVKALGWWQLVGAGAPVIGLAAGGPIVDTIGWRWIFVGQAVISLGAFVVAFVVLHETPKQPAQRFDVAGSVTLASTIVCLLLGMQHLQRSGLDAAAVLLLAAAPIGLMLFVRAERHAVDPLLPLRFFRARNFAASLAAQFGSNFAYMGSFIITPLLVGQRFGFSDTQSAAAMALRPLTFSIVAPIAGYLAVRTGERLMASTGTLFVGAAMVAFVAAAQLHVLGLVFVGLALAGVGMGTASPSLLSVVGNTVERAELGVANAAQSMAAQVGVVVGIGVLSTVQATGSGDGPFVIAYLCGLAAALCGTLAASSVRDDARAAVA